MRIAVVAPRDPVPVYSGLLERLYQLCRYLGERNDVRVYFPDDEAHTPATDGRYPEDQPFKRIPLPSRAIDHLGRVVPHYSALRGIYRLHPWLYRRLQSRLASFEPEAVIVEMPFLVPLTLAATRGLDTRLVLTEHNVEYKLVDRLGIRFSGLLRWFEVAVANRVDAVVTVSETDQETLLDDLDHENVVTAPNGVDVGRYRPHDGEEVAALRDQYGIEGDVYAYHGQLGNAQNREALSVLLDEIWPRITEHDPTASLLLVGANPPDTDEPGVITTGLIDDLPRHLALADIAAVPLQSGSGTKLKILEYLATGIPVVTTPIGAEGLPLVDGESALIASRPEGVVSKVIQLAETESIRRRLSEGGRRLAVSRFDWDQTLEPYREVLAPNGSQSGELDTR